MNITGGQYSKAVSGIRSQNKLLDQQFKLMWIYPMIFDRSTNKYETQIRQFITANIMKELFISNALNMVNMAAQVHPITDERGGTLGPAAIVSRAENLINRTNNAYGYSDTNSQVTRNPVYIDANYKLELQKRVIEKTRIFKKFLLDDPNYKKFNPMLKYVTMDNMIDIPVIVGTKKYDVDSVSLAMLMIFSVAEKNMPLDKSENVEALCKLIKATRPKDMWKVFNNIVSKNPTLGELVDRFLEEHRLVKIGFNYFKDKYDRAKNWVSDKLPSELKSTFTSTKSEVNSTFGSITATVNKYSTPNTDQYKMLKDFEILGIAQSQVDQMNLFFKFAINKDLLEKQIGTTSSPGQGSKTMDRLSGPVENTLINKLYSNFNSVMSNYGNNAVRSMISLLYPVGSGLDTLKVYIDFENSLSSQILELIQNDIAQSIKSSLSQGAEEPDKKIKDLKSLCTNWKANDVVFTDINTRIQTNRIPSPSFDIHQAHNFFTALDEAAKKSLHSNESVTHSLSKIIGNTASDVSSKVVNIIKNVLENLVSEFDRLYTNRQPAAYVPVSNAFTLRPMSDEEVNKLKVSLSSNISTYLYFLFMYVLQMALCDLVTVTEFDLEISKHAVTDEHNYTLVLPAETVKMLVSAYQAKNLQNILTSPGTSTPQNMKMYRAVSENNVKQMTKFIVEKLRVPNVIVIDDKDNKPKIYYKLMYQSDVQSINLSTVDTYLASIEDNLPGDIQTPGQYY